jgi:hypothetical protein
MPTTRPEPPAAVAVSDRPASAATATRTAIRPPLLLVVAAGTLVAIATALLLSNTLQPAGGLATPAPSFAGLGLAVPDVEAVYALERFGGFTFQERTLTDGRPRVVGADGNGGRIELVGPPEDLVEVSFSVPAESADRLVEFAAIWFPDAQTFVADGVAAATGDRVRERVGGLDVSYRIPSSGEASVTIAS